MTGGNTLESVQGCSRAIANGIASASESALASRMLLLTPINAVIWVASGLDMPPAGAWSALLIAGALTALAQYLLTAAYAQADATYLQPFDDLKLPLNIVLGWLVFGFAPTLGFWPGAALIVAASLYLMKREG